MRVPYYIAFLALLVVTAAWALTARQTEERRVAAFAEQMQATQGNFLEQLSIYRAFIPSVNIERAQDALLSVLAPSVQAHAISHEAGFWLYETEGLRGLSKCKNYFNGGCVHGLVERYIEERGVPSTAEIIDACRNGRTFHEARECPHGAGHGFLLIAGYADLPRAVVLCREAFGEGEPVEDCFDGVFMENNLGAFARPPSDRWFKEDDPLYPCNDPHIAKDADAHRACWFIQSQTTLNPHMYPFIGGDIEQAVRYCESVPDADRDLCFVGLARQFQSKFSRDTEGVIRACALFGEHADTCMRDAAESAYAFGDYEGGIALCMRSVSVQDACFRALFDRIASTAYTTRAERIAACADMPEARRVEECKDFVKNAEAEHK